MPGWPAWVGRLGGGDVKLELVATCAGGTCPTVYRTDRGTYVVQGWTLDSSDRESFSGLTGEDVVEVPASLIADLAKAIS